MRRLAWVALVFPWAASGADPAPYAAAARAAYLDQTLAALGAAPPSLLAEARTYTAAMDRGKCTASSLRLKVECLMEAARRFCKGREPGCAAVLDVVVSNVLAEGQFVSTERRYDIMKRARDWRAEVDRDIRRAQGGLAVDFRLHGQGTPGATTPGARIDAYCVATADKSNLPWQTCASSLAWFLATASREEATK